MSGSSSSSNSFSSKPCARGRVAKSGIAAYFKPRALSPQACDRLPNRDRDRDRECAQQFSANVLGGANGAVDAGVDARMDAQVGARVGAQISLVSLTPLGEALHSLDLVEALTCDAILEQCKLVAEQRKALDPESFVYLWMVDHEIGEVRVHIRDEGYCVYGPTLPAAGANVYNWQLAGSAPDALRKVLEPSIAQFIVDNESCPEILKITVEMGGSWKTMSLSVEATRDHGRSTTLRPVLRSLVGYAGAPLTRGCLSEKDLLKAARVAAGEFGMQGLSDDVVGALRECVKMKPGEGAEPLVLQCPLVSPYDGDTRWNLRVLVTSEANGVKPCVLWPFGPLPAHLAGLAPAAGSE